MHVTALICSSLLQVYFVVMSIVKQKNNHCSVYSQLLKEKFNILIHKLSNTTFLTINRVDGVLSRDTLRQGSSHQLYALSPLFQCAH